MLRVFPRESLMPHCSKKDQGCEDTNNVKKTYLFAHKKSSGSTSTQTIGSTWWSASKWDLPLNGIYLIQQRRSRLDWKVNNDQDSFRQKSKGRTPVQEWPPAKQSGLRQLCGRERWWMNDDDTDGKTEAGPLRAAGHLELVLFRGRQEWWDHWMDFKHECHVIGCVCGNDQRCRE